MDSDSKDGTRELLEKFAFEDSRVHVGQTPKDGIYPNFNRCIQAANGQFVYIATSDDTMAPDCLEKLVGALVEHPDCDLAHCPMRALDENGALGPDWWSSSSLFAKSSGQFLYRRHKRIAPLDGILCMLGDNIYTSVTQLLIRRSLFDRIGFYRADWGSLGDFHWNLRAGLAASAVHVPDTWGGWRIHPNQATASVHFDSLDHQKKIDCMIEDVVENLDCYATRRLNMEALQKLETRARELRIYLREHDRNKTALDRRLSLIRNVLSGSRPARQHLTSLVPGQKRWPGAAPEWVLTWFSENALLSLP